jgi:hypothetical protein
MPAEWAQHSLVPDFVAPVLEQHLELDAASLVGAQPIQEAGFIKLQLDWNLHASLHLLKLSNQVVKHDTCPPWMSNKS